MDIKTIKAKQRTIAQNKYRFGVVVNTVLQEMNKELAESGCEYRLQPEDVDLFIKENALGIAHRIQTSIGEFIIQGKLRNRTIGEFEEAMEQIRAYFAQTKKSIIIPLPNEIDLEAQYADNLNR
jgi:hypothetical protein